MRRLILVSFHGLVWGRFGCCTAPLHRVRLGGSLVTRARRRGLCLAVGDALSGSLFLLVHFFDA